MSPLQRRTLAVLAGLLLWLSHPNPFALGFEAWTGYLAWFSLVPLLAALDGEEPRSAFVLGWTAGLACFVPGLYWLTNVQPLGVGAYPAWLALAAWCALFPGLFAALAAQGLRQGWSQPVLWLPAAWTLSEWLRERVLGGFPWINLGSSQVGNAAVLPLAAALGQLGLHYAVALAACILYAVLVKPSFLVDWRRSLAATAMVLGLAWIAHAQAMEQRRWDAGQQDKPGLKVAVIQGGIDLDQVWTHEYRQSLMAVYLGFSRQAADDGAQLIVWPESAFPAFFNEDTEEAEQLKAFAKQRRVTVLSGSTLSEGDRFYNGAVWVEPSGNTLSYAKRHLVPFGEYVPFRDLSPLLDLALEKAGVVGFSSGRGPARFELQGLAVKPLICYESVFPGLAREGGPADLLAVMTVDTWYGRSAGPVWHASQAQLRAVEEGAWVARSASTGISLFAAPDGRRLSSLPLGASGYLVQRVQAARLTPFMRWGRAPMLFFSLGLLLLAYLGRKNVKN